MAATDTPTTDVLLEVIRTLQAQLAAQQTRAERQVARLVTMIEGLTRQLDELLRDRDEERRAKLAAVRAEAAAVAAAATMAAAEATAGDRSSAIGGPTSGPATAPDAPSANDTPNRSDLPKRTRNRHNHGRGPVPEGMPQDPQTLTPDRCGKCGGDKLADGRAAAPIEEWDYVRAHVRRRVTTRLACTCETCGAETPAPPPPPMPFDRAACTFAMMAWLCFAKCGLFLPLDRMCHDFEAQGARIPSATLTRWWQRGADLLLPVAASVRASLLADSHVRMDGTGLLVTFPREKGEPKKGPVRPGDTDANGYLLRKEPLNGQILVFGNDEHAVFWYTPTREGHHILDFFTVGQDQDGQPIRWRGTITADALSAYDCLFEGGGRIETGCNAHALRKFRDEADKAPLIASRALAFIGKLFEIEAKARENGLVGVALLAHRQQHARPVTIAFREWLGEHLGDLLPTNPVRKAMQYYLNHWAALTRFLDDPDVLLDNNWSERALRKIALLRNNSMFAGGEDGAIRLCTLFTLIQTCRLIKVDAYEYLAWALSRSVPHPDNRGLIPDDLTPAAYKATRESSA